MGFFPLNFLPVSGSVVSGVCHNVGIPHLRRVHEYDEPERLLTGLLKVIVCVRACKPKGKRVFSTTGGFAETLHIGGCAFELVDI